MESLVHWGSGLHLTGSHGKFLRRGVCKQNDILGKCAGEKPGGRGPVNSSATAQERGPEVQQKSRKCQKVGTSHRLSKLRSQGNNFLLKVHPQWNTEAQEGGSLREHSSQTLLTGEETVPQKPRGSDAEFQVQTSHHRVFYDLPPSHPMSHFFPPGIMKIGRERFTDVLHTGARRQPALTPPCFPLRKKGPDPLETSSGQRKTDLVLDQRAKVGETSQKRIAHPWGRT